ncbi:hypothetical protein WPG_0644 [Winogradskyella sp. PG-2]|nr:hypothetical protein WPG_0644 [Winogradskyella sp. PG-2]
MTAFDMAPMLDYANANRPPSKESPIQEKIDTTVVFNDLYKTHKDSITALTDDQRLEFDKLKDMVLKVQMDEEKGIFKFEMSKKFKAFDELKTIYEETDEAMDYVKEMSNKEGKAPKQQLDELTQTAKVSFSFENNTFSRFQPELKLDDDMEEVEEDDEDDMFKKQFEELFSNSFYTLTYKFPKKLKSVSSTNAVISEDGKTVVYKVSWNAINSDASVMNLDVVLED